MTALLESIDVLNLMLIISVLLPLLALYKGHNLSTIIPHCMKYSVFSGYKILITLKAALLSKVTLIGIRNICMCYS